MFNMSSSFRYLLALVLATATVVGSSAGTRPERIEVTNRSFAGVENLTVSTGSVDVQISRSSAELQLGARIDERRELRISEVGHDLKIEVITRRPVTSPGEEVLRLMVPDDVRISVDVGSAGVSVRDVKPGELSVETGSGGIVISGVVSRMFLTAGSGSITVADSAGTKDIQTASGDITVDRSDGDVTASAGSGSIRVAGGRGVFRVKTQSGSIALEKSLLAGSSVFETGSGYISLTLLNASDELTLEARAGSGGIRFNDSSAGDQMSIGSGNIRVETRSGSGDQTIRTN